MVSGLCKGHKPTSAKKTQEGSQALVQKKKKKTKCKQDRLKAASSIKACLGLTPIKAASTKGQCI